jgi:phosphoglycolate phosphatase
MLDARLVGDTRRLVVWDCDGTVIDSWNGIRAAVDVVLEAHGFAPSDEVILRSSIGLSLDRIFGRLIPDRERRSELIARLANAYREAFVAVGLDRTRLFPGMASLLAGLQERGAISVIATSKCRSAVDLVLGRLEATQYFAGIFSDDDVERHQRKPDPEMVLLAARTYGVAPADAVVIGDTVFDIEMGRTAGAQTIAVTWGNQPRYDLLDAKPTYIVDDVEQLASLLGVSVCQETS